MATKQVRQRYLAAFSGLNDACDPAEDTPSRVVYMENMWRDYASEGGAALETFPGMHKWLGLNSTIYGMWEWQLPHGNQLVIHAGTGVYLVPLSALYEDTPVAPTQVGEGVYAGRSSGFGWGDTFYLLTGEGYHRIYYNAIDYVFGDVKERYTPITYIDGTPYEQRNMLSTSAYEEYNIALPSSYSHESEGLTYRVLDRTARTCEVSGYTDAFSSEVLYIPSTIHIGAEVYSVVSVGWKAFYQCNTITKVYIAEGVKKLDTAAFMMAGSLRGVYLPDSIQEIGHSAFYNCALAELYLGSGLVKIKDAAFTGSAGYDTVYYHGEQEEYDKILIGTSNTGLTEAKNRVYTLSVAPRIAYFPLHEPTLSVMGVSLGGKQLSTLEGEVYYIPEYSGRYVAGVSVYARDGNALSGKKLRIFVSMDPTRLGEEKATPTFGGEHRYGGSTITALDRCRIAVQYDGRIFFAGNPDLPATVFYASRTRDGEIDPSYVGVYQFFCSDGGHPVKALLPCANYLAVLSGDTVNDATIRYHTPSDTGDDLIPRIYPATDGVSGRGCAGGAVNFAGEPVFLSSEGLEAIGYATLSQERRLRHRSTAIDSYLRRLTPEDALMTVWQGYLVLLYPTGEGFLADSRRLWNGPTGREYEWYRLLGVGSYTGDYPLYRYADALPASSPDTILHKGVSLPLECAKRAGDLPYGVSEEEYPAIFSSIYAGITEEGLQVVNYVEEEEEDGIHLYLVHKTEERVSGTFSPPTALLTIGERLLIGCENGVVAVVNTDRRGKLPESLKGSITEKEFSEMWASRIHPLWYSMVGHRMVSGLVSASDTCGAPHYMKKTVRKSTVADMKLMAGGGCRFQVGIDRGGYRDMSEPCGFQGGELDFADLAYGSLAFTSGEPVSVPLREHTKRWVRKQYRIYSDAFASPFGIYRISYSYTIEGTYKSR